MRYFSLLIFILLISCKSVTLLVDDNYCFDSEKRPEYLDSVPVIIAHKKYYNNDEIRLLRGVWSFKPLIDPNLYLIGLEEKHNIQSDTTIKIVLEIID